MKAMIVSMVAATGLMFAGVVMAEDMPELAKKSGCKNCHSIEKKVVGPAWEDVAKKYKGQADAVAKLTTKIIKGGSGAWGPIPMPPQPKLSDAEAKELATFVMSLAE
ncbi:MAG: c-type cytochrome [Gallionella sp.]